MKNFLLVALAALVAWPALSAEKELNTAEAYSGPCTGIIGVLLLMCNH